MMIVTTANSAIDPPNAESNEAAKNIFQDPRSDEPRRAHNDPRGKQPRQK